MRDPRDTEPLPITHPMLMQEIRKVRHVLLGMGLCIIGLAMLVIWAIA